MIKILSSSIMGACSLLSLPLWADGGQIAGKAKPDSHAPIAVMGEHLHKQGEWMVSYRYMTMKMEDNLQGDKSISAQEIVTSLANPFAPPPTARVVPVEMTTKMHMLGLMYAPSDKFTLMAMINYLEKEMDHLTFMGMTGANVLGEFTTNTSGMGDTKLSVLWGLLDTSGEKAGHKVHLNLGISLPTGSIDEEDQVLTPMGARPTLRVPYAMQLGSGTYDLEPGITYLGSLDQLGWGAQYKATIRLSENDEDYTLGDISMLTGWGSYRFANWISASLRLTLHDVDRIDGSDPLIMAPVQTANPENYGGERIDFGVGINTVTHAGHRFAVEYETPIEQDVNGVQMEMKSMLTLGYQYAF